MLTYFVKFFHLLCALSLIGLSSFALLTYKKNFSIKLIFNVLMVLCFLGMLSGTFLVFSKNYSFHTPWIIAAYLFLAFITIILSLLTLSKNYAARALGFFFIISLLLIIARDAINKSTFLF